LTLSSSRICAEPVFAYPPGIPVLLPGEIIDGNIISAIKHLRNKIYAVK
jgi:arginine/lysine/ornithine decarboxylase